MIITSISSKRKSDILKVLFVTFLCAVVIFLTYKGFMDFHQRWSKAADFEYIVHTSTLPIRCLFIEPDQIGVKAWYIGDYSLYKLKSNTENMLISFQVVSSVQDQHGKNLHWIRSTGLKRLYKPADIELWRLVRKRSFQRNDVVKSFDYVKGFIPVPNAPRVLPAPSHKTVLNKIGAEVVETEVGFIHCNRYLASLVSADGDSKPLLELWTNPEVRPLGIARARWQDAHLEIVKMEPPASWELPKVLNTQLEMKKSDSDNLCIQCHVDSIGGIDVKIYESGYTLNGAEIDLTQSLFHQLQSGMIDIGDSLGLVVMPKYNRRGLDKFVQFAWRKGSFWVKSNEEDEVRLSMDAVLHEGHLRAIPHHGRLVLYKVWE